MTPPVRSECPRSSQGHLPRFPVSWLNERAGYPYECALCGVGMKPVETPAETGTEERP